MLFTIAPTIHTLDSPEFALGAKTLGIVHTPGYPLYLLIAHLFTYLPFNDVGYRVNLFSAFCLAATSPALYRTIHTLIKDHLTAITSTLVLVWSYSVWITGLIAEVYAPQIFCLAISGWLLADIYAKSQVGEVRPRQVILLGICFGITVAIAPSSIFFLPGFLLALVFLKVPLRTMIFTWLSSAVVFLASLLYFPIRYGADLSINMIGSYNATGHFEPTNLQSIEGIWAVVSGRQFDHLFFSEGYIPSLSQLEQFIVLLGSNFLWIGVLVGLIGFYVLYASNKGFLLIWFVLWIPYTYFFVTYGAEDVDMMFNPTFLLWIIAFAYGWHWLINDFNRPVRVTLCLVAVGIMCFVNFRLVDVSDDYKVRHEAEAVLAYLPEDSILFGDWLDIVSLQYLQEVESERTDVTLYNMFLFKEAPSFQMFLEQQRPVYLLGQDALDNYIIDLNQLSAEQHIIRAADIMIVVYELKLQ